MTRKLSILSVNRSDTRGGAAAVAWNLSAAFRKKGMTAWYAVQQKFSTDENVVVIDNASYYSSWKKSILALQATLRAKAARRKGLWTIAQGLAWIADPARQWRRIRGTEEFSFEGSRRMLDLLPAPPDIIHTHVLHGGYFDLRFLQELSARFPVFCTLHDGWMLSGHCAHSFSCTRWETGCGNCPDLTIPVAIERDNTANNWKRKEAIYRTSRLYISAPCQWLAAKISASMLSKGAAAIRVIPNGIDPGNFYPGDQQASRERLGLESDAFIFLFAANGIRNNRWKDFVLMKAAIGQLAGLGLPRKIIFLALGDQSPSEFLGNTEIRFFPYRSNPAEVADFYRAADVYLHAAKAETFPTTILEALACGIPVVATAVGGIPEQIRGWNAFAAGGLNAADLETATGVLTPAGAVVDFAAAAELLLSNGTARQKLGENASKDALERFTLQRQSQAFLDWYEEVIAKQPTPARA